MSQFEAMQKALEATYEAMEKPPLTDEEKFASDEVIDAVHKEIYDG